MLLIVGGATGTGKSEAAIELAKLAGGAIISADSMQVYRGMDIGTNKTTREERRGVEHYLIDAAEPGEDFSAAKFKKEAEKYIFSVAAAGKTPIIAGGTGLYIDAVIKGLFEAKEVSKEIKEKIRKEYEEKGKEYLFEIIKKKDPETAETIDRNNPRRLIRALEVIYSTGGKFSVARGGAAQNAYCGKYSFFVLKMEREVLYDRIDARVEKMFACGLEAEVKNLMALGLPSESPAMQAIGYKETMLYLKGKINKKEAMDKIKQATRNYAKRQMTWFKRYKEAKVIDVTDKSAKQAAKEMSEIIKNENYHPC